MFIRVHPWLSLLSWDESPLLVNPFSDGSSRIEFSDEKTTAFAGLALVERLAGRARLWSARESRLPERGGFDWMTIIEKA